MVKEYRRCVGVLTVDTIRDVLTFPIMSSRTYLEDIIGKYVKIVTLVLWMVENKREE